MYKDWQYWLDEATAIINEYGYKTRKVTSGWEKGNINASLKIPNIEIKEQQKWKLKTFGCEINTGSKYSTVNIEKAVEDLKSTIALSLSQCDKIKNKQLFSDLYLYYQNNKDKRKNDMYFSGEIGREAIDYFKVLDGEINATNWTDIDIYAGKTDIKRGSVSNFKELYYNVKAAAGKEWIKKNDFYKVNAGNYTPPRITFIFDFEKIKKIKDFESQLEEKPKTVEKHECESCGHIIKLTVAPSEISKKQQEFKNNIDLIKSLKTDKLKNAGFYKIGYRKDEFLKNNIVVGRERDLIFPTHEKRKSYFAIVDLDTVIASHNEKTFGNSENYPTNEQGRNTNDRNYNGDKNAQAKVVSVAEKLNPNIIITTSPTASGTPIITIDGIVVSGNNRIMSLKLAKADYKEVFENYNKTLFDELNYGGYGISMDQVNNKVKNPVLVRIDTDFHSYITGELNKYNKSRGKSERQIDLSVRLSQQLKDNEACKNSLVNLISEQEVVSELYNDRNSVNKFKKILLDCNLITENELSGLFTENSLTENGKVLYETILISLVLDAKSIEISQNEGIKSVTKHIVNAIIPLIKNKNLEDGNLINEVNNALLIQNDMISSGYKTLEQYITERSIVEEKEPFKTDKALIINSFLIQKSNTFKNLLLRYNKSVEENLGESLFGDNLTPNEIFDKVFVNEASDSLLKSIELKNKTTENETNVLDLNENDLSLQANNRIKILEKAKKYQDNPADIEKLINSLKKAIKYL
jgi:hypothetical protein